MPNKEKEPIHVTYIKDEPSIFQLLVSGLGLFGIDAKQVFMTAEKVLKHYPL